MSEFVEICPLCGCKDFSPFDERTFKGYFVSNHICDDCGLVFQSPLMTAEELEEFYEHSYRQIYQGEADPNRKDLLTQNGRADSLIEFLDEQEIALSHYLDIGCSAAVLLKRFEKSMLVMALALSQEMLTEVMPKNKA